MTRDEMLARLRAMRGQFGVIDGIFRDSDAATLDAAIALLSQPAAQPKVFHDSDCASWSGGECQCGWVAILPTAPAPDGERVREYERLRDEYAERYGMAQANDDKTDYSAARAALNAFVLPLLSQPAAQQDDWQHVAAYYLGDYADSHTAAECRAEAMRRAMDEGAQQDVLRRVAGECADDLEAWVNQHYHAPDVHPAERRRYDRDMESVLALRAALAATEEK